MKSGSLQNIWEKKQNCPQPAWKQCSGYILYSNVDRNEFLHLLKLLERSLDKTTTKNQN